MLGRWSVCEREGGTERERKKDEDKCIEVIKKIKFSSSTLRSPLIKANNKINMWL